MRIEISAGGINGTGVSDLLSELSSFVSDAEDVISSFKAIQSSTYNLNGGAGNLQGAADSILSRIQTEESKLQDAKNIQAEADSFVELAARIDAGVAGSVNQNKEELYKVNSWLKPTVDNENETPWYEKAWNWLCETGEAIADGAEKAWNWVSETAKKAWDGAVQIYQDNKKIIDTALIVIGAIAAIAAVVVTGGTALIPLLTAVGCPAVVATVFSAAVGIAAVASTLVSSGLNIYDIWVGIDDPNLLAWKKGLELTSAITNGLYSIGTLYNAFHNYSYDDIFNFAKKSISNDGISYGGSYSTVKMTSDSSLYEVHECPSFKASGESARGDLPSIRMEIADHAKTGSFGNSKSARIYRAIQKEYFDSGNFTKAFQMDIDDLSQFGFKYAKEIQEMKKYAKIFKSVRGMV